MPRHSERMGCGEERILRTVVARESVFLDCCTRVLSRSAGCRRIDDASPEARPAKKWEVVLDAIAVSGECL